MTLTTVEGMMRDPVKPLPKTIDPWAFARKREMLAGQLAAHQTKELKQWLAQDDLIELTLEGNVDEQGQHRLSGRVAVALHMQCQRCLEPMLLPLDSAFDYVLIAHEKLEDQVIDGSETLICEDQEFDLFWFIEEEVLLAIPMIVKHDHCKPPLSDVEYSPSPQTTSEDRQQPFADLKELLKSKEHPNGRSKKS